jgi:hypothetical protein
MLYAINKYSIVYRHYVYYVPRARRPRTDPGKFSHGHDTRPVIPVSDSTCTTTFLFVTVHPPARRIQLIMGCVLTAFARTAAHQQQQPPPRGAAMATPPTPPPLPSPATLSCSFPAIHRLSDDCLAVILQYLRVKHAAHCIATGHIWRVAGGLRLPGRGTALRVPQDVGTVCRAVRVFLAHARTKGWSSIAIGPGRWHFNYGVQNVTEPSLLPVANASLLDHAPSYSPRTSPMWPDARRCRHLLLRGANQLVLSGTVDPHTHQPLTELCGQFVLSHCQNVALRGLRISATRSGLLAIASTAISLEGCWVDRCGRSGMLVTEGSRVDARGCVFSDNRQYGVCAVDRRSWVRLKACTMSGNGLHGVYAVASATADVCGGAQACHNREYGLYASCSGVVLVQAEKDGNAWRGVSSCQHAAAKAQDRHDHRPRTSSSGSTGRGIKLGDNMTGHKCSAAGGRVLEYRRSHVTSRPYAVRVVLRSTPNMDMRRFHGRWGTLDDTWREDGLWCVSVDAEDDEYGDGGYGDGVPRERQERLLVHPENVERKSVLTKPVRVYDVRRATLHRFAFHI